MTSGVSITCSTTMKNSSPQAISTLKRPRTMTQPPICPTRLTSTKSIAKNHPHPQDMSMYSRCSFHWNHIRSPSSKNVDIRQNLATVGRMFFPFRWTCKLKYLINYTLRAMRMIKEKTRYSYARPRIVI